MTRWGWVALVGTGCGWGASSTSSGTAEAPAMAPVASSLASPAATPGAPPSEAVVALPPDAPWILSAQETVAVVAVRGDQVQATLRTFAPVDDVAARVDRVLAAAGCTATLPESLGPDRRWHCADPERGYRGLDITLGAAAADGARPVSLVWFRRPVP
jgi:hypothetical protein